MTYFFNGDLEEFLAKEKKEYRVQFNKFNQEFEYFIALLENGAILSDKNYPEDYINHLKYSYNVDLVTTLDDSDFQLWCFDIYDYDLQVKVNSRFFTAKYANDFNYYKGEIIQSIDDVEAGYIYKENLSVSGMGNYTYPNDERKIKLALEDRPLLKEKLLNRHLDISSLYLNNKFVHYENIIDEYFQYKGTFLGKEYKNKRWFLDYENNLKKIQDEMKGIKGYFSVDSFIYDEDQLHFMSEINNRKTMGYIAVKVKEKFFNHFRYFKSILIRQDKIPSKNMHYNFDNSKIHLLSPRGNLFAYYVIVGDSIGEIKQYELELYSKLFD